MALTQVVICLKNRTFAVSQTTSITSNSTRVCCDLLEKSYFCSIANNTRYPLIATLWVVICLKNRTFAVSQTTDIFSNCPLPSCDLLEKSYFCSIANNTRGIPSSDMSVVICLKNRTFAVSQTTYRMIRHRGNGCDLLEKSYFCSIANNRIGNLANACQVVICLKNRTFAVSQTTAQLHRCLPVSL